MKIPNFKDFKLDDIIGAGCGVVMVLVLVLNAVIGALPVTARLKGADVPADAVTLTGSAPGRNDDVVVEVLATADTIYQIKVVSHKETRMIGTESIKQLPKDIIENQLLTVDSISGSTLTSNAIKAAVKNAFENGGIKASAFGGGGGGGDIPAPTNMDDAALAEYYGSAVFTDVAGGKVSDAGTVVYGSGYGAFSDVLVAVLFDSNDQIIGLIVDASGETPEKGIKCESRDFTDQFIGVTSGKDVDVLSGASFTSWAIQDAVDYALENLASVKAG